ncbi:putative membrane protein [Helicobacter pylori Hp A-9]|uniref:Putative membrane protein n=1 Tax=Helicobacter pylori Hp A-9 TaxID=992034 RepID=I9ZYE5_HELPX|nr:putative membrane protein [Helicobacter pylori Hp A-9]
MRFWDNLQPINHYLNFFIYNVVFMRRVFFTLFKALFY